MRRAVVVAIALTALVAAAAVVGTWFLWPPAFVWTLLLSPVAILLVGLAVQAAGIVTRGD